MGEDMDKTTNSVRSDKNKSVQALQKMVYYKYPIVKAGKER